MSRVEYEISKDNTDTIVSTIIDSQNNINLANMASSQTLFLANRDAIERVNNTVVDSVCKATSESISCIERNGSSSILSVEKAKGDISIILEKNTSDLRTSMYDISNNIISNISDTNKILIDNNINQISLSTEIKSDIQLDLCKLTEKLTLQASENVSKVEICVNKIDSNINLQIANLSSTIHLEALNNIKVLSAQMIECCCELKEMMTKTTNATHQLIREMENNRMNGALQSANMELMMKKYQNNS